MIAILKITRWFGIIATVLLLSLLLNLVLFWVLEHIGLNISTNALLLGLTISIFFCVLSAFLIPSKTDEDSASFFDIFERKKEEAIRPYNLSLNSNRDREKSILTMSGGGIKAGLFHLGSLKTLNAQGVLSTISAFSGVSGGAITTAWLGANWAKLEFNSDGIAINFDQIILDPLYKYFTEKSVSSWDMLFGFLPSSNIAARLAKSLDRNLYCGLSLSDLPKPGSGPDFFIASTDMRTNTAWYFGRDKNGPITKNYKLGHTKENFSLGQVVAASAAFPPYISPYVINLQFPITPSPKMKLLLQKHKNLGERYMKKMILGDGGIYDNLGAEKVKGFGEAFISNASGPFRVKPDYPRNWASQYAAIASRVHRQVEQRRKIHLGDLSALGQIKLHIWEMDDIMDPATATKFNGLEFPNAWQAVTYRVWLGPISNNMADKIIQHGEALSRRQLDGRPNK